MVIPKAVAPLWPIETPGRAGSPAPMIDRPARPGGRCSAAPARPPAGGGRWPGSGGRWRCARRRSSSCWSPRRTAPRSLGQLRLGLARVSASAITGSVARTVVRQPSHVAGPPGAGLVRRLQLAAQRIGLHAAGADHPGAGHLGGDVGDQGWLRMRRMSSGVQPPAGSAARTRPAAAAGRPSPRPLGVHAGGEGLDALAGLRVVGGPLGGHVAAVEEQPRRPVLRHIGRPEPGRQPAQAALAPQVDLPEPVAGGVVALQEERIAGGPGVDVRDAPAVDDDLAGAVSPFSATLVSAARAGRVPPTVYAAAKAAPPASTKRRRVVPVPSGSLPKSPAASMSNSGSLVRRPM